VRCPERSGGVARLVGSPLVSSTLWYPGFLLTFDEVASWPVAALNPERGDVRFREMTRPKLCRLPTAAFDPKRVDVELVLSYYQPS